MPIAAQVPNAKGKVVSFSDIAEALGIDTSYVSNIFSGKRVPTYPVATKLAKYLGLPLEQFYKRQRAGTLPRNA